MPGAIRCKNGATPPRNAVVCQRNWAEIGRRHHCVVGFTETLGLFEVPLYAWRDKTAPFSEGRVHAKVAVSDGKMCFITSANLTGYAMDRNMEAGVLIAGGHIPTLLDDHLRALAALNVIEPV